MDSKMGTCEIRPKEDIIGPIPNCTKPLPEEFTMDYFMILINDMPNHKATGKSKISAEMIKYGPRNLHVIIYEIFCCLLTTGITPDEWSYNLVVPIYKQKGAKDSMDFHRPICLSELLKKLMESSILPETKELFPPTTDQFGFQKWTSTSDAGYDLIHQVKKIQDSGQAHLYSMDKMDIKAAFDSLLHAKLRQFILQYVHCLVLQYLLLSLLLVQNVCISMGSTRSRFMQLTMGILQGSRLSPLVFISILDWALKQGPEVIRGLKTLFADDFLVLGLIEDREHDMRTIKRKLEFIGLKISDEKSYQIKNSPDTWLGFRINNHEPAAILQIEKNMENCDKRFWTMVQLGNWKSHYPDSLTLAAYRSQCIPILEYGLNIFEVSGEEEDQIKSLAAKVDIMLNRHIRIMVGVPIYIPIPDLHSIFQYGPFYNRWCNLRSRFFNHLSSRANITDLIQYAHNTPWKFQIKPCLMREIEKDKSMRRFILRLYAKPDPRVTCSNCNNHHSKTNQMMQCFLKHSPLIIPDSSNQQKDHKDKDWLTKAREIQQELIQQGDTNVIHITVDSSFERLQVPNGMSNMGAVFISTTRIYKEMLNQDHLNIQDSTRAEACGLARITQHYQGKKLRIYCDSKPALNLCNQYMLYFTNNTQFQHIKHADVIAQGHWFQNEIELTWIKGHARNLINNHCDLLADFHNTSYNPSPLILQTNMSPSSSPIHPTYFRISKLIFALETNKLDPDFHKKRRKYQAEILKTSIPPAPDCSMISSLFTDDTSNNNDSTADSEDNMAHNPADFLLFVNDKLLNKKKKKIKNKTIKDVDIRVDSFIDDDIIIQEEEDGIYNIQDDHLITYTSHSSDWATSSQSSMESEIIESKFDGD